jgi:hypothetical protein
LTKEAKVNTSLELLNNTVCRIPIMEKILIIATTLSLSVVISASFVSSLFAQQNQTDMMTATNQTGSMMNNQTNQTGGGGNQTQKGPLQQLGEALGGVFGGGNQSK